MPFPSTPSSQLANTQINLSTYKYNNSTNPPSNEKSPSRQLTTENNDDNNEHICKSFQAPAHACISINNNNNSVNEVWSIARLQLEKSSDSHNHHQNIYHSSSNSIV